MKHTSRRLTQPFRHRRPTRHNTPTRIPLNVIGPQVKRQRQLLGLTQSLLNERLRQAGLKIGKTAVARIENQCRQVSDIEFFALARLLEISPELLLSFNDPQVKRDAELIRYTPRTNIARPSYSAVELKRCPLNRPECSAR
jgi:hypothetical protein